MRALLLLKLPLIEKLRIQGIVQTISQKIEAKHRNHDGHTWEKDHVRRLP